MSENTLMTDAATTNEGSTSQGATDATSSAAANTGAADTGATDAQQQQSTDGKTDDANLNDGADGDTNGDEAKSDDKAGAPEKYEFTAPDGREFDAAVLEQFSEVAKELNLSQEDAQKVIDKIAPALAEKQTKLVEEARTQWGEASKADKEFGGDKLQENLAVAKKALDTFGSPELRALLQESGLGNHPEMIRAFFRAGKSISEDRIVPAGTGGRTGDARDPAKSLYPNQQT